MIPYLAGDAFVEGALSVTCNLTIGVTWFTTTFPEALACTGTHDLTDFGKLFWLGYLVCFARYEENWYLKAAPDCQTWEAPRSVSSLVHPVLMFR